MNAVHAAVFLILGAACFGVWLVTMNSKLFRLISYAAAALALSFFLLATVAAFRAAQAQNHHPLHKDFYQGWQRNDGKGSCCNARIVYDTGNTKHEIGDCEPTEAKVVGGQWHARVPLHHGGGFIPIPDAVILKRKNPTQGGVDAHLCWTPAKGPICFVPPTGAM